MRWSSRILLAIGLMATVVAVGFWLARVFQSPTPVADAAPERGTKSTPQNTATIPAPTRTGTQVVQKPDPISPGPATEPRAAAAAAAQPTTGLITNWEDKVDEVLRQEAEPAEIGKKFLELLPQLPEEGRVEALEHAANLLADADYAPLGRMLSDPKLPEAEVEILMRDMLNRSNAIKLPLLLQVARTAGHAKATEAREILEVFLGEDYGSDWDKWQGKVDEFLKEEPVAAAEKP